MTTTDPTTPATVDTRYVTGDAPPRIVTGNAVARPGGREYLLWSAAIATGILLATFVLAGLLALVGASILSNITDGTSGDPAVSEVDPDTGMTQEEVDACLADASKCPGN